MWRKVLALLAMAAAFVPGSTSQVVLGTSDDPELEDAVGDVEYSPAYAGSRDHRYLDIQKAWFEYNNETDVITLVYEVVDGSKLSNSSGIWAISCELSGRVLSAGDQLGFLLFHWTQKPDSPALDSKVVFRETEASSAATGYDAHPMAHGFTSSLSMPGQFRFDVERAALLRWGDEVHSPTAMCREQVTVNTASFAVVNQDRAESDAAYSFVERRRVGSPDTEFDPIERLPPEGDMPSANPGRATVGPALALGMVALAAAALGRRRP